MKFLKRRTTQGPIQPGPHRQTTTATFSQTNQSSMRPSRSLHRQSRSYRSMGDDSIHGNMTVLSNATTVKMGSVKKLKPSPSCIPEPPREASNQTGDVVRSFRLGFARTNSNGRFNSARTNSSKKVFAVLNECDSKARPSRRRRKVVPWTLRRFMAQTNDEITEATSSCASSLSEHRAEV